jgi:hypothetical protein
MEIEDKKVDGKLLIHPAPKKGILGGFDYMA